MGISLKDWLGSIIAIAGVLLAVLLLLLWNVLLLIPGLMLAYTVAGVPWGWHGVIPDPVHAPAPMQSFGMALLASFSPILGDYLLLRVLDLP